MNALLVSFHIPDIQIEPFALKFVQHYTPREYERTCVCVFVWLILQTIAPGHSCIHKSDPLSSCTNALHLFLLSIDVKRCNRNYSNGLPKDTSSSGAFELNTHCTSSRINNNYIHIWKLWNKHAKHILMLSLVIYRRIISRLHELHASLCSNPIFLLCISLDSVWFECVFARNRHFDCGLFMALVDK